MERFALFLTACCTVVSLSAQHFTVKGTVTDFSQEQKPVTGVLVLLVQDKDTVAAAFTDKAGKYDLGSFVRNNNGQTYTLSFLGACYCDYPSSVSSVELFPQYDTWFIVDRQVARSEECEKTDNTAYFLPGDHKTILNFEARRLRQLLDDFPGMIVRFTVCQQPGEPERLGKKRMKTFRRLLEEEQIANTRVLLNKEVFYFSEDQAKEAKQPAIQGIIVALEE